MTSVRPARLLLRRLRRAEGGTSLVEFAIVAPIFLLMLFGVIELAIILFIASSIESAVLEASRFGITGGTTTPGITREQRVLDILEEKTYGFLDMDTVDLDTLVYDSFSDIGRPEPFEDDNLNGGYDEGEPFTDVNGNGSWDPDMGLAGLGGPSDIVVYRIRYEWGVITPFMQRMLADTVSHVSSVAVRNEPF